jgi:hypothetical protein
MRAIENRISYSRHTLGAQLWDDNRCSVCGVNDAWMRINIDGVWSYLLGQARRVCRQPPEGTREPLSVWHHSGALSALEHVSVADNHLLTWSVALP